MEGLLDINGAQLKNDSLAAFHGGLKKTDKMC